MRAAPVTAYVGLGSNLGDRAAHLEAGFAGLAALPGTRLIARSRVRETAPVGGPPQGPFLNAAARLETMLAPADLLAGLLDLERARGRRRRVRWGPRTLDLDLLLYGNLCLSAPGLTVPHPRLAERIFVLEPLLDLDPGLVHPATGELLAALRARCADRATGP